MTKEIVDLHMHVVPGLDDGARNLKEALVMLCMAADQGVTDVFCTTHNGSTKEDADAYFHNLDLLKKMVAKAELDIRLHQGCEVLCSSDYMEDIIYGLDIGAFPTLGNTKYVLTELYPDAKPSEAVTIIKTMQEHGYKPIIAHMERNYNITDMMVGVLIKCGALIQVNTFSFQEDPREDVRKRAQTLLQNRHVHFIGSDAHRIDHRPPIIESGVEYIINNASPEYAEQILCGNAKCLLM